MIILPTNAACILAALLRAARAVCQVACGVVCASVLIVSAPRPALGEARIAYSEWSALDSTPGSVPDSAFVVVSLDSMSQQSLRDLLLAEIQHAQSQGRTPFLELGATWCAPCQALQALLDTTPIDSLIRREFAGTYLIRLDVDQWKREFESIGIPASGGIPAFWALDTTGQVTAMFAGDSVSAMTPDGLRPVHAFFQAHQWKRPSPATSRQTR